MSSFKKLYTDVISSGFDTKKVQKATGNRDLIVYVKESYPYFLVTDNYYFVRLYFTKKAVDSFKSQFKNANIVDLKSKTIKVKDWDIEMSKSSSFTSYGGVEIKLIANDF
jgi:type IV secretory pathway component VirB8